MEKTNNKVLYYLHIAGVLLIITMCTAFLLSFVNGITKDVIAENEIKKTNEAISGIFSGVTDLKTDEADVSSAGIEKLESFFRVLDGQSQVGYYAVVAPVGFKGEVRMIVGLDNDGRVKGIKILSHSETVGIGDAALDTGYLNGFSGKGSSDSLPDAISGATYSSGAVRNGVKAALSAYEAVKGGSN